MRVQANSPGCRTVVALSDFTVESARRDELNIVRSADNVVRLVLPIALANGALVGSAILQVYLPVVLKQR